MEALIHDFLILTEIFSTKTLNIQNFNCYNALAKYSGPGRPQSCISIAISKHIKIAFKCISRNDNHIAVAIEELNLIVIAAYFEPKTDLEFIYQEKTAVMQNCHGFRHKVLESDFKCRLGATTCRDSLFELLKNWDMHCINKNNTPTYKSQNGEGVIDLIFVNSRVFIQVTQIEMRHVPNEKHEGDMQCCLKGKLGTAARRRMQVREQHR